MDTNNVSATVGLVLVVLCVFFAFVFRIFYVCCDKKYLCDHRPPRFVKKNNFAPKEMAISYTAHYCNEDQPTMNMFECHALDTIINEKEKTSEYYDAESIEQDSEKASIIFSTFYGCGYRKVADENIATMVCIHPGRPSPIETSDESINLV